MKTLSIILITFLVNISAYGHSARMAIFELSETDGHYTMSVALDIDDLLKSLITSYPEFEKANTEREYEEFINRYLQANFQLQINSQCQEMIVRSISNDDEYVRILIDLPFSGDAVSLNVFNTCLIDYNEGHLNIFKSSLHDRIRTFKLDKDRISTELSYDLI
ncbi:DUF6702 family protein [Fulvivirga lutimaris]|uniref:DUF6702 family protein n=1 Tax=Fulvivirga lutimaris TaxID=1819566 RepID=UPI0012BBD9B6|nr:DUF6702 family protein [Fulvivirga lutimaris]MTI38550.1 hypothetical protein [Fulvivirga lutimaris]